MKHLILMITTCLTLNCFAGELLDYDSIRQSITTGNNPSVVVDLKSCDVNDPNSHKIPMSLWGLAPSGFIVHDSYISFDATKYAATKRVTPSGWILQRGSFATLANGETQIIVSLFDAETHKKILDDIKIKCTQGTGIKFYVK